MQANSLDPVLKQVWYPAMLYIQRGNCFSDEPNLLIKPSQWENNLWLSCITPFLPGAQEEETGSAEDQEEPKEIQADSQVEQVHCTV